LIIVYERLIFTINRHTRVGTRLYDQYVLNIKELNMAIKYSKFKVSLSISDARIKGRSKV